MSARTTQPYAVMLDVAGKLAVVVGGGPDAQRAARSLAAHKANVVVIAPDMPMELREAEAEGLLTVEPRDFAPADLKGAFLAVAASGSAEIDAAVVGAAREHGVLVNVAGDAGASDYIVPSVIRRGALQIAVSTAGGSPWVAREVRRGVAAAFGQEWEAYTRLMSELRVYAMKRTGLSDRGLAPLFAAVDGVEVRRLIVAGRTFTARELFEEHRAALDAPAEGAEV